jgi:N-acetylmuramoyl-L-alanine amidase
LNIISSQRGLRWAALILLAALPGVPAYARTHRGESHHSESWARDHFAAADRMREALNGRPLTDRSRHDYQRVLNAYRNVYFGAPASTKADPSVVAVAETLIEMGRRFDDDKILNEAIAQYKFLRKEYPGSKYRCDALFTIGEIYKDDLNDPEQARAVFQEFLQRYPHNRLVDDAQQAITELDRQAAAEKKAGAEKNSSKQASAKNNHEDAKNSPNKDSQDKSADAPANAEPAEHASDQRASRLPRVTGIRHWSTPDYTRVAIDLESEVKFGSQRIADPDRIFFDLRDTKLASTLVGKSFDVDDGFLKKIRVAQFQPGRTRVVLEVDNLSDYDAFLLPNPYRLIVDIHGKAGKAARAKAKDDVVKEAQADVEATPKAGSRNTASPNDGSTSDANSNDVGSNDSRLEAGNAVSAGAKVNGDAKIVDAKVGESKVGESKIDEARIEAAKIGGAKIGAVKIGAVKTGAVKTDATTTTTIKPGANAEDPGIRPHPGSQAFTVETSAGIKKVIVPAGPDDDSSATPVARHIPAVARTKPASTSKPDGVSDSRLANSRLANSRLANSSTADSGDDDAGLQDDAISETRGNSLAEIHHGVREAKPTASGDRSLIRALGLKIGKIVIDPGHGGHDTGTIGPNGLEEKDLVLEVGRRLGKLLETRLGAEVVYTRKDDTFIPLETRTAIANQQRADLFISIHANSSDDPDARGVETYYLNFTSSPEALDVAARENAVSEKSIYELQDLVKKIALKEKIEESREFAGDVQQSLHSGLAAKSPAIRNRGVKKAPFIVLIGANMPSILAEISFVSNPTDEHRLETSEYRQRIAESLYRGIAKYVNGLSGVKLASKMDKASGQ